MGPQNELPNEPPNGIPNELPNGIPNELPNERPNELPNGLPNELPNGIPNGLPKWPGNGSRSGPELDPKVAGIGYQTGQGLVPHFLASGTRAVWRLNNQIGIPYNPGMRLWQHGRAE